MAKIGLRYRSGFANLSQLESNLAMPQRKLVGKSGVTPCKHFLLDKLLGRECGALTRLPKIENYAILDLTAGDGVATRDEFGSRCSPGIALKHVNWLSLNYSKSVYYLGVEKQPQTFSSLVRNCDSYLGEAWDKSYTDSHYLATLNKVGVHLINRDSTELRLDNLFGESNMAAFIYNDPNHVEEWCITPDLLNSAPRLTTSLSTLGCNVGGLKRINRDRREAWYGRVDLVIDSILQGWHDACLFSVGGSDQWAYLITAPERWRESITAECHKAVRKIEGRSAEAQVAWFRQDASKFKTLQDHLFLTKKELGALK